MILADRGLHRASFIAWLERHDLDYVVVRIKKGSCITEKDGRRWKLGEEGLKPGESQSRFHEGVRYGLSTTKPPPRAFDQRGVVLEALQEPSEGSSTQAARRALVFGHELRGGKKRHLLVLAARLVG